MQINTIRKEAKPLLNKNCIVRRMLLNHTLLNIQYSPGNPKTIPRRRRRAQALAIKEGPERAESFKLCLL